MQNKPNFQKSQMNVNPYNTTDYERKRNWTHGENKPNSNPIKANLKRAKMNINSNITKDYRKKDDFTVRINKPNFFKGQKLMQSVYLQRIMKNNADMGSKKTNPIQTLSCLPSIALAKGGAQSNGPISSKGQNENRYTRRIKSL